MASLLPNVCAKRQRWWPCAATKCLFVDLFRIGAIQDGSHPFCFTPAVVAVGFSHKAFAFDGHAFEVQFASTLRRTLALMEHADDGALGAFKHGLQQAVGAGVRILGHLLKRALP